MLNFLHTYVIRIHCVYYVVVKSIKTLLLKLDLQQMIQDHMCLSSLRCVQVLFDIALREAAVLTQVSPMCHIVQLNFEMGDKTTTTTTTAPRLLHRRDGRGAL